MSQKKMRLVRQFAKRAGICEGTAKRSWYSLNRVGRRNFTQWLLLSVSKEKNERT